MKILPFFFLLLFPISNIQALSSVFTVEDRVLYFMYKEDNLIIRYYIEKNNKSISNSCNKGSHIDLIIMKKEVPLFMKGLSIFTDWLNKIDKNTVTFNKPIDIDFSSDNTLIYECKSDDDDISFESHRKKRVSLSLSFRTKEYNYYLVVNHSSITGITNYPIYLPKEKVEELSSWLNDISKLDNLLIEGLK